MTFSDPQGIAAGSLKIVVNGVDATAAFLPLYSAGEVRATLAAPFPEGTNSVTAEVFDLAGNRAAASSTFTIDVTPPVVSVVSPAAGAHLNNPTPSIAIELGDALSGVEPTATRIFVDNTDVTAAFAISPDAAMGTLQTPLASSP